MGIDWIPGLSQIKSTFQALTCDFEGAARTNDNFLKECPGFSQLTSTAQLLAGDPKAALETQKRCLGTINNVANGLPVIGHCKGLIHHAVGDKNGGNEALNAATRSLVVLGSGAAAGVATGGVGAIPAGIAAGTAYDLVDTAISDKPKGTIAAVKNAIDNPNGGNFFDAAAGYVFDGLAGYSGGQMGSRLATQSKLSSLESMRAAKTEQLNNAMFSDNGANSGNIISLGKEINALTSQINQIQYGIPQYYYDPKINKVVVEMPKNGSSVPIMLGQSSTQEESDTTSPRAKVTLPENGLDMDIYSDVVMDRLSEDESNTIINQYETQTPKSVTVAQQYRGSKIASQTAQDQIERDNNPERWVNLSNEMQELFLPSWLHVQFPSIFGYTGAALLNNFYHGFLHTFVRHWDQWQEYIPGLEQLITNELSEIKYLLDQIRNARNPNSSGEAINRLNIELARLPHLNLPLLKAQILIYKFMQKNISETSYLGEGVSNGQQVRVYFQVGNQVMVICVSKEIYSPSPEFNDQRPVRLIVTSFFIDRKTFDKLFFKKKCWPKK